MLSIKDLTITAQEKKILSNISIDFNIKKTYVIMGVNGSGKSSLAKTIMGSSEFKVVNGSITINKLNITTLPPNERAANGIFLSPQSPIAIPGVTVRQLLRTAIPREKISSKELTLQIALIAEKLKIPNDLLTRSLNENFSGGERKKMEVLQAAIINPDYIILDEIDTGVDVDALKTIATFLNDFIKNTDKTLILITHYNRILSYLDVDEVIVLANGKISKIGDVSLANKIENEGYGN